MTWFKSVFIAISLIFSLGTSAFALDCQFYLQETAHFSETDIAALQNHNGREIRILTDTDENLRGVIDRILILKGPGQSSAPKQMNFTLRIKGQGGEPDQVRILSAENVLWYSFYQGSAGPVEEDWFPNRNDNLPLSEAVEFHNDLMRQFNMRRIKRMTLNHLGALAPEFAIPELYHQVARGHLFGSDSQAMDVEFQLNLRKHVLRNENGHVVMVSNLIPISPSDVGFVLHAFYNKLELLMRGARSPEQALGVASWARHMITEIQAGVDCNTRAAQAVYNYVLARVNAIHGTRYPLVDFWRAEVRDAFVTVPVGGVEEGYYIFSDGIKDYLNKTVLSDLDAYARAHGRRYLFFRNPLINTAPASTAAVVLDYDGDLYTVARYLEDFNLEEWHTHRDFVLEKIELVSLGQIMEEPVLRAETAWIQTWMSGQLKRTVEKNTNPFGTVSRTLAARRATRQAAQAIGIAPTQIAGAPR